MSTKLTDLQADVQAKAQLADGAGNFKEINAKLDAISSGKGRIEEKLDRHIERAVK